MFVHQNLKVVGLDKEKEREEVPVHRIHRSIFFIFFLSLLGSGTLYQPLSLPNSIIFNTSRFGYTNTFALSSGPDYILISAKQGSNHDLKVLHFPGVPFHAFLPIGKKMKAKQ